MRKNQSFINPVTIRQFITFQFTHGQHHLLHLTIDFITVIINALKFVVRADFLKLRKGVKQRFLIPQTNAVDRAAIVLNIFGCQRCIARQLTLFDLIKVESLPCGGDAVGNERRFFG